MAVAVSACGARRPFNVTPDRSLSLPQGEGVATLTAGNSLESFMAKVRRLSTEARPERVQAATLEGTDPLLMAAIAASVVAPAPATYRAVASEYRRLRVFDRASGYLDRALRLDPRDPLTHDALARLWRDTGLPYVALGDAYRAVHFSGGSAETHNTLGTILQALGRHSQARLEYTRAVGLDPRAAYAWSNLCYAWLLEGRPDEATDACELALRVDPLLSAAQNNLGLARAQAGDLPGATRAFELAGHAPRALFNMGIVQLADGRYAEAARLFQRAHVGQPSWRDAEVRARQALQAAEEKLE